MAPTKWLAERRRLLGASASELVFALTGLDPECENYAIATTFTIDNLLHHTYLDDPVADGMVLAAEQLDRLADRALERIEPRVDRFIDARLVLWREVEVLHQGADVGGAHAATGV
jgi:hypothetical protein